MKNTALITGASSGIGRELALIHAEKTGDLVIVARSEDKLKELKKEIESKFESEVYIISKDLTKRSASTEIYDELQEKKIKIEYLINNAGYGGHGKFHEREWALDEAMIELNVMALTSLTRLFLPHMVEDNHGRILNVSSTASLLPGPLQAVYFATKAYVSSFSHAIAGELHDTNITVTALLPGATETGFAKTSGMDKTTLFNKTASANKVALEGYNAMMKGKLQIISGVTLSQKLMMAAIPFSPKKMLLKQIRGMQEIKSK